LYERYVVLGSRCSKIAAEFEIPHIVEVNETARLIADTLSSATAQRAFEIEDRVLAQATKVIAVSGVLRDHLVSIGVEPQRVEVMHNGIIANDFRPGPSRRKEARARLGIDGHFAVGCLQAWHGTSGLYSSMLSLLEQLVKELPAYIPTAVLVMIGGGAASKEVRARLSRAAGRSGQVLFTGSVPHLEIPALLAAMDVGLVVHHSDFTSPLKVFEYMASGAVCVACDRPNLREMIEEDETGVFFPPGDVHALLAALSAMADDPERRLRIARAGRDTVLENHTWESNARRIVELIAEVRKQ